MGSGCSRNKKARLNNADEAFFAQYANYAKVPPSAIKAASNGFKLPEEGEAILPPAHAKIIRQKSRLDWERLEKSAQSMNFKLLKEDLNGNPTNFLVNLILMSVQFFKNYEKYDVTLLN